MLRARYDELIRYCDEEFGKFISRLSERDELRSIVIILSSDHGESFEHGYFGHGKSHLYEQVTSIPLIIKESDQKEGQIVLLNLPAYNFLRIRHDEAVHTKRRYTIEDLKEKVEKAGFKIERITYRNTILFPLAVIKRIIEKIFLTNTEKVVSDLKPLPGLFNKLFTGFLFLENMLLVSGLNFPFGLSLYCIARKKRSNKTISSCKFH